MAPEDFTGVYCIRNTINGKVYVGSAAVSFRSRWNHHQTFLRRGKHCNGYLQNAWNKYGEAAFVFEILEECFPLSCMDREQAWIDKLKAATAKRGYNLRPAAHSALGYRHTKETLLKMSIIQREVQSKPHVRKKRSESLRGHAVSESAREKIAAGHRGLPGKRGEQNAMAKLTQKDVDLIRQMHVPHSVQWGCRALAEAFDVSQTLVSKILRGTAWKIDGQPKKPDGRVKVTVEQRKQIRLQYRRYIKGCSSVALAREYGISSAGVLKIVRGCQDTTAKS